MIKNNQLDILNISDISNINSDIDSDGYYIDRDGDQISCITIRDFEILLECFQDVLNNDYYREAFLWSLQNSLKLLPSYPNINNVNNVDLNNIISDNIKAKIRALEEAEKYYIDRDGDQILCNTKDDLEILREHFQKELKSDYGWAFLWSLQNNLNLLPSGFDIDNVDLNKIILDNINAKIRALEEAEEPAMITAIPDATKTNNEETKFCCILKCTKQSKANRKTVER